MIENVIIRKATTEDIKIFYPDGPLYTVEAWIAFYKGLPACLAGIAIKRGQAIPFADVKENDAPKITVWRTAKEMFRLIKTLNLPLITATECKRSPFLEALGFVHLGPNQGWEMYKCQP